MGGQKSWHISITASYDLVMARGLAPMPTLAELTIPFCKIAGKAVLHKKGDIAEEMKQAKRAIATMGGKLIEIKPVELSEFTDNRVLVVIEKIAPTPEVYPRGQGLPTKRPSSEIIKFQVSIIKKNWAIAWCF